MVWQTKPFIGNEEAEQFHIKALRFLLPVIGIENIKKRKLVLPNASFFPPTHAKGNVRVRHIAHSISKHASIKHFAVRQDNSSFEKCIFKQPPSNYRDKIGIYPKFYTYGSGSTSSLGGIGLANTTGRAVSIPTSYSQHGAVYFNNNLRHTPELLISCLAHGAIAHFLSIKGELPTLFEKNRSATISVAVVLKGFGIFGANASHSYHAEIDDSPLSKKFSSIQYGVLTELEWVFLIAIFCEISDQSIGKAKPHLKPRLWRAVKQARKYVRNQRLINQVIET